MITKMTAYQSSDGKFVGAIEEVHKYELRLIFDSAPLTVKENNDAAVDQAVSAIVNNRDKVVDILTTGPKSRPKARSANGATRKRAPRAAAAPVEGKPSTPAGAQA